MADSFGSVMGQRLLFWSGWFFTVSGVIVGLYLSKEYPWIGILIAVGGLLPLGTHGAWVHKRLGESELRHQKELEESRQQLRDEVRRREAAEQQLACVPVEALTRLAALVTEGATNELIGLLRDHADRIGRLRLFTTTLLKPLAVRTFEAIQGELYVIAKGHTAAIQQLRPGDPFLLFRTTEAGIRSETARIVVHQPVSPDDEVVRFRSIDQGADDVVHLLGLASNRSVEGLKGFGVAIAVEMERLPDLNYNQVAEAIPYLAALAVARMER